MSHVRSLLFPVLAIVLAVAAALATTDEAEKPRKPSAVAVTQTSYACPAGAVVSVATGQITAGAAGVATVLPGQAPAAGLAAGNAWGAATVDGQGVIVEQPGRGAGAVGYFAGTAPKAGGGGLVVGSCPGIVDDAWLLGLGSGNKHFSTLILTNLAASPAVVDLKLWGPEGKIDAVNADNIVLEPFSVRRIRIDSLAAGEPELAIHAHRRRGSVSVVVNDTSTATFKGTEPIAAMRRPSRSQIVPGLVQGTAGRTLLVLNPGGSAARVDVEVMGAKGTFTPSGLEQIKIEAGTVRAIPMPESAGSDEQALRLTSDRPVSATVRMTPTANDYAYAEAMPALTGPAVVPVELGAQSAGRPRLVLTAPNKAASVEIQAFTADMSPLETTTVALPAGATTAVTPDVEGAAYLVLRPTGEVAGAATYAQGDGLSSLALTSAPITASAPHVRPID